MHLPSRTGKVMRGPIILLITSAPATTSQLVSRPRDSHLSHVSCMHCQTPLPKMLLSAFLSQTLQWVTYPVNSEVHPHCKNLPGPATHSCSYSSKLQEDKSHTDIFICGSHCCYHLPPALLLSLSWNPSQSFMTQTSPLSRQPFLTSFPSLNAYSTHANHVHPLDSWLSPTTYCSLMVNSLREVLEEKNLMFCITYMYIYYIYIVFIFVYI